MQQIRFNTRGGDRRQGDRRSGLAHPVEIERRFDNRRQASRRALDAILEDTASTKERLNHALARLQQEPRENERRTYERRQLSLPIEVVGQERRSIQERRAAERRET
jgi:hypothetical protein